MNLRILLFVIVFFAAIVYNIDIVSDERNDKVPYDIRFSDFKIFKTTKDGLIFEAKSKNGYFGEKYILEDIFLFKKRNNDFEYVNAQKMYFNKDDWVFNGKVNYVFQNINITAYELSYLNNQNKIFAKNFVFRDKDKSIIGQSFDYDIESKVLTTNFANIIIRD